MNNLDHRLTALESKAPAAAEAPEQQRARLTALARKAPSWNMGFQIQLLHALGSDALADLMVEQTGCAIDHALAFVQVVSECERGL
jgi:hypothetical protein